MEVAKRGTQLSRKERNENEWKEEGIFFNIINFINTNMPQYVKASDLIHT